MREFVAVCPDCRQPIVAEWGTVAQMWRYNPGDVTIGEAGVEAGDPYDSKMGDVEESGQWWCDSCIATVTPVAGDPVPEPADE